MRPVELGLLALAGCYGPQPAASCTVTCSDDADCPDGLVCRSELCRIDGEVCSGLVCAGTAAAPMGTICFDSPVAVGIGGSIDTGSDQRCHPGHPAVCLIITDKVDSGTRFEGPRPVVLWSATTLVITSTGALDVSSNTKIGAAGDFAGCARGGNSAGSTNSQTFGSGGAGGSFGTFGGRGGAVLFEGTPGGVPRPTTSTAVLSGGCRGSPGGADPAIDLGGHGGGVAYLMAHDQIRIVGSINASGGGASTDGSDTRDGGAGGGSGGRVVLDAPLITFATGSVSISLGGGGASGTSSQGTGNSGADPTIGSPFVASAVQGPGAPVDCSASAGGGGSDGTGTSAGNGADVPSGVSGCSAGGGGGGDGLIETYGPVVVEPNAVVKPLPTAR